MEIIKTEHGYRIEGLSFGNAHKYDDNLKRWTHYITIGSPIMELDTNNCEDMGMRQLFRTVSWAKLLYQKNIPYMDEDPYGRRVQRGWISWEIWDLRNLFGMSDRPLDEFLSEYKLSLINNK